MNCPPTPTRLRLILRSIALSRPHPEVGQRRVSKDRPPFIGRLESFETHRSRDAPQDEAELDLRARKLPYLLVRRGRAGIPFALTHNEGSGAPGGATQSSSRALTRGGVLAIGRHASRRSTGGIFRPGRAFRERPYRRSVSAGSRQGVLRPGGVPNRRRADCESACRTASPSALKTPHESAPR